jgi:hypothetical protein
MQMQMKQQTKGMILLTTILILSLLAALIFSMQHAMWLYYKIHQKTDAIHQAFEALEAEAFHLGGNGLQVTANANCLSENLDVNYLLFKLKSGHGCMVIENKKKYYFWINKLKAYKKQWIIGVQSATDPHRVILLRFSEPKGLISWRYLTD